VWVNQIEVEISRELQAEIEGNPSMTDEELLAELLG